MTLLFQDQRRTDLYEQLVKDLYCPLADQILKLIDVHRGIGKAQRTEATFVSFQKEFLRLVALLSDSLFQFKTIQCFADILDMTFERFHDRDVNHCFGELSCAFVMLVAKKCCICEKEVLWFSRDVQNVRFKSQYTRRKGGQGTEFHCKYGWRNCTACRNRQVQADT